MKSQIQMQIVRIIKHIHERGSNQTNVKYKINIVRIHNKYRGNYHVKQRRTWRRKLNVELSVTLFGWPPSRARFETVSRAHIVQELRKGVTPRLKRLPQHAARREELRVAQRDIVAWCAGQGPQDFYVQVNSEGRTGESPRWVVAYVDGCRCDVSRNKNGINCTARQRKLHVLPDKKRSSKAGALVEAILTQNWPCS